MNVLMRSASSWSVALTLKLMRTELMEVSMRQHSCSFRQIVMGFSSSSLLVPNSTSGLLWRSTCSNADSPHARFAGHDAAQACFRD